MGGAQLVSSTMNYIVIVLAIFAKLSAAVSLTSERIVGGDDTTITRYPFMSSLEYYDQNTWIQICGGTLITEQTILSAAHCFYNTVASSWRVRLGSSYPSEGGTLYNVSTLVLHENYDPETLVNDIAIIRLSEAVTFSDSVGVAKVAGSMYHLSDDTSVVAVGWGTDISGSTPDILQEVEIDVINLVVCRDRYDYLRIEEGADVGYVDGGMICTGILDVGGKDTCTGDDGGPVLHDDVVIGITSWGHQCANETYPRVNTRVSYYTSWIIENSVV